MKTALIMASLLIPFSIAEPPSAFAVCGPDDVVVIDAKPDGGGWLGVSIQDMTPGLAKSMAVDIKKGALVNEVIEGSPAADAGIRDEDIIIEFNGKSVDGANDLAGKVQQVEPKSTASLVLIRGAERKSLEVTVGEARRKRVHAFTHPVPPMAPRFHMLMSHSSLGMETQEMTDQLAGYFGAPENEGVLITAVEEDGAAKKAGLKAGDVVLKVGSQTIREEDDIWDEVEEYKKGDKIPFDIIRDKSRQLVTLEVEDDMNEYWFQGSHSDMEFEFDHESLEDFEDELRREIEGTPEIDELKIRLKEMGKRIKEWGKELKKQFENIDWVRS